MSRERQIQIGAAGIILLGVGLLVFVGLGFAQGGGPEPPAYWAKSFRADRPRPAAEMVSLARPAGAASAQAAAEYEVTAIEPPETLDSSRAFGINNAGQVVGRFFNLNETLGAEEDRTAYIWNEASGARLLPTLAGHSSAWDVDQGELGSGFSFNAGIDQHAVRWDGAAGTILDLGTLENAEGVPGRTSTAYGINSLGEVVGSADTPNLVGDFMPFHAFIYSDESGMLDLGTLTADYPEWQNGYSIAYGVNTEGQVVGIANDSDFYYYPFIFDPVNDLRALNIDPAHTPAGTYPQWYAVAINDTGVIGGFVTVADNQSLPYYWPDPNSDPVPLPMPDGFPYGEVYGINLSGIMVGIMWDSDADTGAAEHAFVFDTTNGLRDLNNLIPAGSGWVLNFARDINASGQIVGTGDYLGERRGFVLRPLPEGSDTVGTFSPSASRFFLRNALSNGAPDYVVSYGKASSNWVPLAGDWDGDGADSIGVYNPDVSRFMLRDTNNSGPSDYGYIYGPPGQGWLPILGDWDGNGSDTPGVYDPARGLFLLANSHGASSYDYRIFFGPAGGGWLPLAGDWDGDGDDSLGIYDPVTAEFRMRNALTSGEYDISLNFGPANRDWIPITGDWDADGVDTIGVYNSLSAQFRLRNELTMGPPDLTFRFGAMDAGWIPLSGDWDGS
jgi:probable HAF family extracellular repeat protein